MKQICGFNSFYSLELVLGHPVLASSAERLLMYRIAYYPHMTLDQDVAIRTNAAVDEHWTQAACQLDPAFNRIIHEHDFDSDAVGALKFAVIVACHYLQNLKLADPVSSLVQCPST